jgi:hypothetical protein
MNNISTQTNLEEAFVNLANKQTFERPPELVEPIKIIYAKKNDSFWDVHYDFVCVVCIFSILLFLLYRLMKSLEDPENEKKFQNE